MPTYTAKRELLASRDAVWAFLAEPTRLADWWPGLSGVHADRRGLAPGARWRVQGKGRPNPIVGPKLDVTGMIVVLEARKPELATWQFVDGKVDVELRLAESAPERTTAELTVSAPWLSGLSRKLPQRALTRLHALCQTGAEA